MIEKTKPCKKINPKIKIKSELSKHANFVGLFDYTYNDILKSKKITLEDVGVLAYGCFIHYDPVRIKWFKQFTNLAKTRSDAPIWRLLQIRHRKFGSKESRRKPWIEKPVFHDAHFRLGKDCSNVFTLRKSIEDKEWGINPLTVGFIVSTKTSGKHYFRARLSEDTRELADNFYGTFPFNHTYPGAGIYHGYFMVLNKKTDFWQKIDFEVKVKQNPAKPGCIITNFYQTKAAGLIGKNASGLDVAVCIASGRTLDNVEWNFGESKPKKPRKKFIKQTADNIYKNARPERYSGKVIATAGKDSECRDFHVIMDHQK